MTRSTEDVYTYYKQALDLLKEDHPHYEEIKKLLIDQVNDELNEGVITWNDHAVTATSY